MVIYCGEPWHLTKCPAEFPEVFRGKLWSLIITLYAGIHLLQITQNGIDPVRSPRYSNSYYHNATFSSENFQRISTLSGASTNTTKQFETTL